MMKQETVTALFFLLLYFTSKSVFTSLQAIDNGDVSNLLWLTSYLYNANAVLFSASQSGNQQYLHPPPNIFSFIL